MKITIEQVLSEAQAKFGSTSVMKLTDGAASDVPAQRTGVPQLDIALGVGGVPKGRVVEIFGPESSGKSTLALSIIAQAQKEGGWAWYGDMEHSLDPAWAEAVGVDLDKLLISQPENGEECLDLAEYFIDTGVVDIVVIDSVASLVPKAELAGPIEGQNIGLQARLMSRAMRRQVARINKKKTIAIYINQIREKIGVMWGSPETTSGGRALKFYSSVRLDVRRTGNIGEDKENAVGNKIKITVKKNKVAPPFKICECELYFDNGFDLASNLFLSGVENGIIKKEGNTYSHGEIESGVGIKLGVGKNKTIETIKLFSETELNKLYADVVGVCKIKRDGEKKSRKDEKILKYLKKYTDAPNAEEKERLGKKVVRLGGTLPTT